MLGRFPDTRPIRWGRDGPWPPRWAVLGRQVIAFVSATHAEPDVEIEVYLLGDPIGSAGEDEASGESRAGALAE